MDMTATSRRSLARRAFSGGDRLHLDPHHIIEALQTVGRSPVARHIPQAAGAAAKGPLPADGSHRGGAQSHLHRLIQRTSFGWSVLEQARADALGPARYLEEQLAPEQIDDFGLEDLIAEALPATRMSPLQTVIAFDGDPVQPAIQLVAAAILRALYSPRQLFERTVELWTDHFNIDLLDGVGPFLKPTDDRRVIRRHALGRFRDLLGASAKSPAMLAYLTNDTNVKGHPNENYARELMELHTLGVDGGYTEEDVKEVARCFTGWTYGDGQQDEFGQFVFRSSDHDRGEKRVLGQVIPAGGGRSDAEQVLDILAAHPSTARFIARKILVHFWGYEPSERIVVRVAARFGQTGGDIRATLHEAMRWFHLAEARPKLKRPFQYVVSAVRATFSEVLDFAVLFASIDAQGNTPFFWHPPNGYPDSEGYWSGLLLPRLDFALIGLEPELDLLRTNLPFMDEPLETSVLVEVVDGFLLHGGMTAASKESLTRHLESITAGPRRNLEGVALTLASPEFQYY